MQPCHHEFDPVETGPGLDVDRNAPAIVTYLGRMIRVQDDLDLAARPVQGLVDRVVDDLPQAVEHAPAVSRPDVHAGPLADRVEALKHSEMARRVGVARRGRRRCFTQGGGHGTCPNVTALSRFSRSHGRRGTGRQCANYPAPRKVSALKISGRLGPPWYATPRHIPDEAPTK